MPELPEVETVKNAVNKAVCGANIIAATVLCDKFREKIPADFAAKITGAKIIHCQRIAKYIVISLNNRLSLVWHLGMSGKIKILPQKPTSLEKHDHVVIETDKGCLIFNDPRRFGLLTYCESAHLRECSALKNIGPDPFDDNLTAQYLYNQLQAHSTPIKVAVLEQKIICGIGNIYASEALFKAKISPFRPAKSLSLNECEKLLKAVREVLSKAIKAGGSTLRDYRKPDGSSGEFQNQHCVYNKTGQRCPECVCDIAKTGGIKKAVLGGRSAFYCETLQK